MNTSVKVCKKAVFLYYRTIVIKFQKYMKYYICIFSIISLFFLSSCFYRPAPENIETVSVDQEIVVTPQEWKIDEVEQKETGDTWEDLRKDTLTWEKNNEEAKVELDEEEKVVIEEHLDILEEMLDEVLWAQ